MADVQIATYDDCLFGLELVAVFLKGHIVLFSAVLESIQLLPSVGNIGSNQVEFLELNRNGPSLLRMFLLRQVFRATYRQIFGEDSHARISRGALTKVPVAVVACNSNGILLEGVMVDLSLVETEDVRLDLLHIALQVLPVQHCSNPIHVP
jgi:hypothetical protein